MALTPDFSVTQTIDASNFILTDTSTGSDVVIFSRRIYLQLSNGTYLVPVGTTTEYIPFPLAMGASITLNVLNIDYPISITVTWINSVGDVLYSKTQSYFFKGNDEEFMYGLVQNMDANRSILQDTNFIMNCFTIDMYVSFGEKAVVTGNAIGNAQFMQDLAQNMINQQNRYF